MAAGGPAAELPGGAADRPAMAPARPRSRGQAVAAPGADPAHLVQPRQVGRHDVAHGRPARAQRSRRVPLQPLPFELRREGLQLHRLHQSRIRQAGREAAHPARPRGAAQDRLRHAGDHQPRPAAGLPGPSQVCAGLQQGGVQGGHRRQPERHRHPQHLDLPQDRAARRAEGPDHQQQRDDQRHQPALYRRRRRQLDHRPDLGPRDAHRPGRHAAALGGRERRAGSTTRPSTSSCAPA